MHKDFQFTKVEAEKVIAHFGEPFYKKVVSDIEKYAKTWRLSSLQLINYYSVNCVFKCYSLDFGNAVLKIGNPCREVNTEFNTLSEYNGNRFCKVFDADTNNGVIIEELITPGTQLRAETSLDKRLSVFCSLYKGLHIIPANDEIYPTYMGWVSRIAEYMRNRQDYKELYLHMKKAENLCHSLCTQYPRKMLLHGDFHHDNILLNEDNIYMIIDPKGVVGDPIFDVPRFILNEFGDDIDDELFDKINYIIAAFEKALEIPNLVIRQCLYIETVMAECWSVESGDRPAIDDVIFAEKMMNTGKSI